MSALRKTFLSNLLLLIGINLLIKPFYLLVIEAGIQERLGPDAYGMYFALLNISFILNILPDIGITNWNNRHVAASAIIVASEFRKIVRIRIFLGLIYLLACTIVGLFIGYQEYEVVWLIVLAFNQMLATGVLFLRSYLTGMHAFASDRIVSVLDRLLLIGLMGAALLMTPTSDVFPVSYLIYGQTLAYAATLIVAFYFVRRLTSNDEKPTSLSTENILSASLPFALLIFFSMTAGRIDAVMLERLKGSFDAGIYAMAFRLGDMLTMISYLFAVLLLPMFSKQLAGGQSPKELFGISFKLLVTGCFWVTLISVFNSEPILNLFYTEHTKEAAATLPYTMGAALMFSLQYATGTLLTAGNKMKVMIFISIVGLALNAFINVRLIPHFGAVGAAQAAFITQTFVWLVQCIFIQRFYHVWTVKLIAQCSLFLALATIASYFIFMWSDSLLITTGGISAAVVMIGIVSGALPIGDIKKIIPVSNQHS